jgi:hypothetical protein
MKDYVKKVKINCGEKRQCMKLEGKKSKIKKRITSDKKTLTANPLL